MQQEHPPIYQPATGSNIAARFTQQLAKTIQAIQAFVSFAQFEACAPLALRTDSRSASHTPYTSYTAPAAHEVKA